MFPPLVIIGWHWLRGVRRPDRRGLAQYSAGVRGVKHPGTVLLIGVLAWLCAAPLHAEERAVQVRLGQLEAVLAHAVATAQASRPAMGADPGVVERLETELEAIRMQFAEARAAGREAERATLEEALQRKAAELQTVYANNWRALVERNRWRSRDVRLTALTKLIETYGRERGVTVIVDQETGKELFRRDGWTGQVSDLTPEDLTEPITAWLRERVSGQGRSSP